jgi:hypothetical protein
MKHYLTAGNGIRPISLLTAEDREIINQRIHKIRSNSNNENALNYRKSLNY